MHSRYTGLCYSVGNYYQQFAGQITKGVGTMTMRPREPMFYYIVTWNLGMSIDQVIYTGVTVAGDRGEHRWGHSTRPGHSIAVYLHSAMFI